MADNVDITAGSGTTVATDQVGTVHYQRVKLVDGTLESTAAIAGDATNGLDVDVTRVGGNVTVVQATATNLKVDASGVAVPVTDNASSLTVDGTVTADAGTGSFNNDSVAAEAGAVTNGVLIQGDDGTDRKNVNVDATTGDVQVDVTNTVTVTGSGTFLARANDGTNSETALFDADTGVGNQYIRGVSVRKAASGGSVEYGSSTDPLRVDPTGTTTQPVSDASGSLTVDAPVGTPVNVQIGDATNTATIRNLAANDALNVAIVDAAGDQITSFGGGTQYAEDSLHVTGDQVTMAGVVQQSADAALSGDGDRSLLQVDATGYLKVNVKAGGGTGGTAIADESAFTEGTTNFTPVGGVLNDTITSDPTEDQGAAFRITAKRGLHVNLRKNDGTEIASGGGAEANALLVTVANNSTGVLSVDDNGAALTVDGTVTADAGTGFPSVYTDDTSTHSAGASTGLGIMAAAAPTDGSVDANDIGMVAMSTDRRLHTDTQIVGQDAALDVSAATVTVTGTVTANAGTGTLATSNAIVDGWDNAASDGASVSGDVAHDTADAGEPIKIGAKAIALKSDPTAVASNDRTNLYAMRNGIQFTIGGHPNLITKQFNITDADGAQTDLNILNAVVGVNDIAVVTHIAVACDNANTGDVAVRIGFGATNTPAADAAGIILSHPGIAAGSGMVVGNGAGIIGMGAVGEELRMTSEDPVGGALDVVVGYFIISNA